MAILTKDPARRAGGLRIGEPAPSPLPNRVLIPLLLLALALLPAAVTAAGAAPDLSHLQGLGDTRYHRLDSQLLERPLHLYVRAPAAAAGDGAPRPVVYLLDGGLTYPLLSAYYHYLHLAEELPELVLVGISYGSDRFEDGNHRSGDFTAPAEDREWWGGAPRFQAVLASEVLPLVESRYPADPARRILFGQSLGGQFVLYSALTRPGLFQGHIASNPALHRNLPFFLAWRGDAEAPVRATRLFVSVGEFEEPRFRDPATEWIGHWQRQPDPPFVLEARVLPGQSHLSAAPASFRAGLDWLLDGN